MTGFPLLLDVTGRRVLVVGGGVVATRRAIALAAAGAQVRVVAPKVSEDLHGVDVDLELREFADSDLDGAWLAVAATDNPTVNSA
ncbi:MAG: NAD(P)-dependent oxidoreductase, partial [Jatrophihabitantaceae bacterium]